MNERDREAADDWIRDNMPDPAEYSFEDTEEAGSTESYFFPRYRDSATVVYKVAVKEAKLICGFTVVLKSDPGVRQTGASVAQADPPNRCEVPCNMRAVRHRELLFVASKR